MKFQKAIEVIEDQLEIMPETSDLDFTFEKSELHARRKTNSSDELNYSQDLRLSSPLFKAYKPRQRSKSVDGKSDCLNDFDIESIIFIDKPDKINIITRSPLKETLANKMSDNETGVETIDLSKFKRDQQEQKYEGGKVSIVATALTAAAFSGYLIVKGFRSFFA